MPTPTHYPVDPLLTACKRGEGVARENLSQLAGRADASPGLGGRADRGRVDVVTIVIVMGWIFFFFLLSPPFPRHLAYQKREGRGK